jgi:hypothetical protein
MELHLQSFKTIMKHSADPQYTELSRRDLPKFGVGMETETGQAV